MLLTGKPYLAESWVVIKASQSIRSFSENSADAGIKQSAHIPQHKDNGCSQMIQKQCRISAFL
jgi:hypothetical protein